MATPEASLVISMGAGYRVLVEPGRYTPLRLSNMVWDFPERPDLIALAERQHRLDFLRDHLKSLCGLWEKLPRLFLDAYFRDVVECIRWNRARLEPLAAAHGRLFDPEDWGFAAFCPLPQAYLPAAPETPVDFAFWTGTELHAVCIQGAGSQNPAQRDGRDRLRDSGTIVTEISGIDLQRAGAGDLIARLPCLLGRFWEGLLLPSSPFRVGELDEILPARS